MDVSMFHLPQQPLAPVGCHCAITELECLHFMFKIQFTRISEGVFYGAAQVFSYQVPLLAA